MGEEGEFALVECGHLIEKEQVGISFRKGPMKTPELRKYAKVNEKMAFFGIYTWIFYFSY